MINQNLLLTAAAAGGNRSLRFNSADSAYLNRTPASAGNRRTWTWSAWVKRSSLATTQQLFTCVPTPSPYALIYFHSSDNKLSYDDTGSFGFTTNAVFRDVSAWYHIVIAIDTTQATSTNRIKVYVNNVDQTFSSSNYGTQNFQTQINTATEHKLGTYSGEFFNGYMTEVHFIDGSAKTPSDFGETDTDTGVWKPKAYTGTYGTNGFYLNFQDNSNTTAGTLGKDSSGNGNNWTPNNFYVGPGSTNAEKAGIDSLVDHPVGSGTDTGAGGEVRGNYCTANPLDIFPKGGTWTVSNGNLDLSLSGTVWDAIRGTTGVTSGKWYWEITATGINNTNSYAMVGIQKGAGGNFQDPLAYLYYSLNGQKYNNGSGATYGNSWTTNDVIGVAFDADAGEIKFYKNNTVQNSGTAAYTGLTSGPYTPVIMLNGTGSAATVTCNFGQRPFAYTAPSGFKALCTQNLPTPTIGATATTRAGKYFNTVLYTGTGITNSVTGVGFQPDFTWIKQRNSTEPHVLSDSVRGSTKALYSNTTGAEETEGPNSFDSDGFTLGSGWYVNRNTYTYAAWAWKAATSNSTNNAGSIQSTVRANTTAGFSIVTYTGNGSASATVGHGLGVTPSMIICKSRSATTAWYVKHTSLASNNNLLLAGTDAQYNVATGSGNGGLGNLSSSDTFGFLSGTSSADAVNLNGGTFVAYCFAAVAGYSAFGSYVANGSTDGNFIYTGMAPRFVLIKCSSTAENWVIFDTARDTYNVAGKLLRPNLSDAELDSPPRIDILSNGFKVRASSGSLPNTSSATYIYAAFAQHPFKYALAR